MPLALACHAGSDPWYPNLCFGAAVQAFCVQCTRALIGPFLVLQYFHRVQGDVTQLTLKTSLGCLTSVWAWPATQASICLAAWGKACKAGPSQDRVRQCEVLCESPERHQLPSTSVKMSSCWDGTAFCALSLATSVSIVEGMVLQ